jgi:hypothetical protein
MDGIVQNQEKGKAGSPAFGGHSVPDFFLPVHAYRHASALRATPYAARLDTFFA